MRKLLVLAVVGFGAQLVDGALGMGYGVTSTSMLLVAGLTPAMASASVHLAEVGTNIASGISHHKLRNVDWRLVGRLGVPGAIGAFAGATVLSRLPTAAAAPIMAVILTALGAYIMGRFVLRPPATATARKSSHRKRFLVPLGLLGGFVDATGGGGWGPISTTTLLSAGRTAPRTVIGSVDTSEFLVSVAASAAFIIGLGSAGIDPWIVVALLGGGVLAAPIAAWLVSRLPAQVLGVAVGGFIVLTNMRTLLIALGVDGPGRSVGYVVVALMWLGLVGYCVQRHIALTGTGQPSPPPGADEHRPEHEDSRR